MPRISLWQGGKHTNDYKFFDRRIHEMFTAGGTDIYVHKYLGPQSQGATGDATKPNYATQSEKNIQDLLLLENRDRKYDSSIYNMRALYNVQDLDFDLSQFGLFLQNDTLFITFHLNDMVENMGRKLMNGDVLELPHLKEFYSLDDTVPVALKRFYVVQDATRSAEGFSATWWPHLWRVKAVPLVNSQEFKQIIDQISNSGNVDPVTGLPPVGSGNVTPTAISSIISTYQKDLNINDAVIQQAEANVPQSGYDTTPYWIPPMEGGTLTNNPLEPTASPEENWTGYLAGDGIAPNGKPTVTGTAFPAGAAIGDFCLRLDFLPNRLFRYDGKRWVKVEDAVRTNVTPGQGNTLRDQFVNNNATFTDSQGNSKVSKQNLSDLLNPKTDH